MKDKLKKLGIAFEASEKYYTACPKCSSDRNKDNSKTLSVQVDENFVRVKCLHEGQCEWNEPQTIWGDVSEVAGEDFKPVSHNFVTIPSINDLTLPKDVITYPYYNAEGLQFVIVRTKDKKFFPIAMNEEGDSITRRPKTKCLYRYEHLSTDDRPVIVVEGEKAADAAANIFKSADIVSWAGGCGSINSGDWELIKTREVILWPDNDAVGVKAMQMIADKIGGKRMKIVDVSELPPKADLADEISLELIKKVYLAASPIGKAGLRGSLKAGTLKSVYGSYKEGYHMGWTGVDKYLRLPERGLVVVNGRTNHGKSLLMINFAANLLRQTDATVIYLSYELTKAETTLRLIKAMQGEQYDPVTHKDDKIYYEKIAEDNLEAAHELDDYLAQERLMMTDEAINMQEIEEVFQELHGQGKRAVLVVDYIQLIPSTSAQQSRYLEIKNTVETMRQLALKYGHVIIGGSQLTEGETHRQDQAREGKDIAFTASLVLKVWNKVSARTQGATKKGKNPDTKEEIQVDHYSNIAGDFIVEVVKTRQGQSGRAFGFNVINGNLLREAADDYKNF